MLQALFGFAQQLGLVATMIGVAVAPHGSIECAICGAAAKPQQRRRAVLNVRQPAFCAGKCRESTTF